MPRAANKAKRRRRDDRALKLRRQGMGLRDIAKRLGVSHATVWIGIGLAREREAARLRAVAE